MPKKPKEELRPFGVLVAISGELATISSLHSVVCRVYLGCSRSVTLYVLTEPRGTSAPLLPPDAVHVNELRTELTSVGFLALFKYSWIKKENIKHQIYPTSMKRGRKY